MMEGLELGGSRIYKNGGGVVRQYPSEVSTPPPSEGGYGGAL